MSAQELGPIRRCTQPGPFPLSAAQTRLWILHQFDRRDPSWNRPLLIRLIGRLDRQGLERSLSEVVRRHEILRTVFPEIGGEPVQIVRPAEPVPLKIASLEDLPRFERQIAAEQIAATETQVVFDLAKGPLVRALLLRLDEQEHVLLLLMHHIVFDEWSEGIMLRELTALYETFSGGEMASPLPELPIQYTDFSVWQGHRLTDVALETQLNYWRQQLRGLSALMLPTDYPRNNIYSNQGARHSFIVPLSLVEDLKKLSRREHVTLFTTLLTTFKILLSRYTGHEDITVGVPVAGRTQLETESLIGYFVNLLVLRVALPDTIKFRDALHRVGDAALDAYAHQDVPFQRLVKELRPEGLAKWSPLFQVMFELRNLPKVPIQQSGGLRMETVPFTPDFIGALDLVLEALETPDGLNFTCRYASALFRPGTIERMTVQFVVVLQCLADNPNQRLSELPLGPEAEKNQLKLNWNVPKTEVLKDSSLPQLSEALLERMAETRADVSKDQHILDVSIKTDLEGKIVQIWRDVLGLERVGVNDNFFAVGGHSLLMIEIGSKLTELLGKQVSAMDLCTHPTIGSLADYLRGAQHE